NQCLNSSSCLPSILAFMAAQSSLAQLPQIPPITDPKFIEDCVKIHNELRAIVNPTAGNMKYMTWDASLAKTARAWSKKCVFKHNVHIGKRHACHPLFKTVGENLWMGILTKYVVRNATTDWFNEVKYFEMSDNTCSRVCGHYTQVVWASTYKVGCALKMCPNLGKHVVMFVCNYSPDCKPFIILNGLMAPSPTRPPHHTLRCNHSLVIPKRLVFLCCLLFLISYQITITALTSERYH
uniref:SCP domain-containing protein n=1 Tax=Vombatus ursinus TaxID=29139 RepID=A0A4X2KIM1_VOMUR